MSDAPNTDIEADEAEQQHPTLTPDLFRMFMDVLALIKNEREFKRRLNGLHTAMTTLAADRAAFEDHKAAALAEIERREKHAGSIWKIAKDAEAAMKAREQRCEQREIQIGVTAGRNQRRAGFEGSTLTGEPEREPVRQSAFSGLPDRESKQDAHVDRHGLSFPPGVTLGQANRG
jgi:hypothetical protein